MKDLLIKNVEIYRERRFRPGWALIRDGVFRAFPGSPGEFPPETEEIPAMDGRGGLLAPGFIDIHTHGGAGVDVNAADGAGLKRISAFFASQGTSSWNASVVTDTKENTLRCLRAIREVAGEESGGARLLGAHLEGPFLSPEYRGSMPERLLLRADPGLLREYVEAAGGRVSYLTVAPETEGAISLIREISGSLPVAIGHSGADYETACEAFRAGARCVTHTFNAMRLFHQHEPAIMGAALESDCWCEAICDGRHLHPGSLRMLLKCKGPGRVVAVTDSIMAAGLPDGQYRLGVNEVVVENGDARLKEGGVRAGSTLTCAVALKNLVRFTGRPAEEMLPLLTENPAAVLRMQDRIGALREGLLGDCVLLSRELSVLATVVGGHIAYLSEEMKRPREL